MRNEDHSDPLLTNVIFVDNKATRAGGGMDNMNNSAPTLIGVTFQSNTVPGGVGGGMANILSNPSLTNVTFTGNSAEWGGGMANGHSSPTITNATFQGNSVDTFGGAISNQGYSNPVLTNVTISGNTAVTYGGGIYSDSVNGNVTTRNSILYGNSGGEIYNTVGNANVTYSIVQGGYPGTGNLNANPLLGTLQNNGGSTQTMALLPGSPAIDAGDAAACPATDQRGVLRPQGSGCDIGAFEAEAVATPTPTSTPPYSYNPLYLSLTGSQTIGGVSSANEDILRFDGTNWSRFFDGSDVGLGSLNLFAFSIMDEDTILMSFSSTATIGGIDTTPQDILRFDATSLGDTTAGTFSMYFDGSDVGFDNTSSEKIDSISLLPDGRLLISTNGSPSVPGLTTGKDEDVLAFTPTSLGWSTSGTWALYFDGSDVGLSETSDEDIDALDVVGANIYLSTLGNFSVTGLSGADEDVFVCAATSTGDVTACTYSPSLYFDGSTWGLTSNDVDAFNFLGSGPVPTAVPTNSLTPTPIITNTPTLTPTATQTATPGAPVLLTFTPDADARVPEASPTTNYGNATTLLVDSGAGASETSYIRFVPSGIHGSIQSVKLRVYCTTNGTNNGPAAYLANSTWTETGTGGITWNLQPALLSGAFDNKGAIAASSWVEYDVTALVTGNGTYTFALVGDGTDGVTFSSSEGAAPPQLVIATTP
jgi:predicted outer membrane repeat protein